MVSSNQPRWMLEPEAAVASSRLGAIGGGHAHGSRARVLFCGEEPVRSAPSLTLAHELASHGMRVHFAGDLPREDTWRWLSLLRRCDLIIFVHYREVDSYLRRQLHLARLLGCTVVRWWVGTDVLVNLEDSRVGEATRQADRAVDLNIAVAPHLVDELASIGIKARCIPSVTLTQEYAAPDPYAPLPRGVLVYLPTQRRAFYGDSIVRAAVRRNPDLRFVIVNDESHSLASFSNVTSLGWVEPMDEVWAQVGLLLRVTQHDGLPRMVLEAMARQRYVIYSWPLEGCWLARRPDEVQLWLDRFKALPGPNRGGEATARRIAGPAVRDFVTLIERCVADRRTLGPRLRAAVDVLRCQRALRTNATAIESCSRSQSWSR